MVTPTSGSRVSSVSATGDQRIDALLKGAKWGGPAGTGVDITYSFPQFPGSEYSTSTFGGYGPTTETGEPWDSDVRGLNAPQQRYFSEAMNAWSEVAKITPVEVADDASAVGDIRAAFSGRVASADDDLGAWAYYPFSGPAAGDVWLNSRIGTFDDPPPGSAGFYIFLHETGHAVGLSHPFAGGKGALDGSEDSFKYTVMSYASPPGVSGYPYTPMLYDILAIQHLYGANTSTRGGDTTYAYGAYGEHFETIWDGGGVDTIDLSAQSLSATVSLVDGTYSSIGAKAFGGPAVDNVAIAFGVIIEDATGGSGNDVIVGNAANNDLRGRGGNDSLEGAGGDDMLNGGSGDDTLQGGAGDDELDGGDGTDRAVFFHDFDTYNFVLNGDASMTVDFGRSGPLDDGSDRIRGVEQFVFADTTKTREQLVDLIAGGDDDMLYTATFADFSDGSSLVLNGDAARVGDVLRLTPATDSQAGSAFLDPAFAVGGATSFQTQFTFRLQGGDEGAGADGIAFVLNAGPAGASALGEPGGSLGYGNQESGNDGAAIVQSVAIEFDTFQGPGEPDANHVALMSNGDVTTHLEVASPAFDLNGGAPVTAWIDYEGSSDLLHVFVSNTGSKPEQALFSRTIDLTQVLGDGTHAGFTGGTGALSNAQDIISWTFDASDAPVSADTTVAVPAFDMSAGYSEFSDVSGLTLNGDAARVGDVLRLTPAAKAQAGSAFLDTAFAIGGATSFRTEFTFRLGGGDGDAGADGLAFVLHGAPAGAAALGEPGGSLAYDNGEYGVEGTAIGNSIAVEFDTYRGPGDPDGNHVGLLINGDVTTHLDFASPAFDLNGGESVTAWVDYDGAGDLLEVFVSDSGDRPATALFSETIDLSLVVGDSAHAGFAGATGDLANAQDIESWTIEVAQSDFFD